MNANNGSRLCFVSAHFAAGFSERYPHPRCLVWVINTLLVVISNSKCIGYMFYKKGGMTKERLVEFLNKVVFGKYKNYLIVMDNAGSHKNKYVQDAITNSGNKYLYITN